MDPEELLRLLQSRMVAPADATRAGRAAPSPGNILRATPTPTGFEDAVAHATKGDWLATLSDFLPGAMVGHGLADAVSSVVKGQPKGATAGLAMAALGALPGDAGELGKGASAVDRIVTQLPTILKDGGATFTKDGMAHLATEGYAVAMTKQPLVRAKQLTRDVIERALTKVPDGQHLGIWFDPTAKRWELDAPKLFAPTERQAALQAGVDHGQKAIWDFQHNENIHLLQHYSPQEDLTHVDPQFMGSGMPGAEVQRPGRPDAIHYYAPGADPEIQFKNLKRYFVAVPDSKLLTPGSPQWSDVVGKARTLNGIEQKIADAGMFYRGGSYPNIIKGFTKEPVLTPGGGDVAPPTAATATAAAPLGAPDLVGDPLSTVSHYQHDHHWYLPNGNALTINAQPIDGLLHIHSIDASNGIGSVGPSVIRQAIRQLTDKYGATEVAGMRVTGANPMRRMVEPVLPATTTVDAAASKSPNILGLTSTLSPAARTLLERLSPENQARLTMGRAAAGNLETFNTAERNLEPADVLASAAIAGSPTRGFYPAMHDAMVQYVTDPTQVERLSKVVAALSPQNSVEENIKLARGLWSSYQRTGSAERAIKSLPYSLGPAWDNNLRRALQDEPLSGPKVRAFGANLGGDYDPATLDSKMAMLMNWAPGRLGGARNAAGIASANAPYLAYQGRLHQLADLLPELGNTAGAQAAPWGYVNALTGGNARTFADGALQRQVMGIGPDQLRAVAPDIGPLWGQAPSGLLSYISGSIDPSALQRIAGNIERFTQGKYKYAAPLTALGAGAAGGAGLWSQFASSDPNHPDY